MLDIIYIQQQRQHKRKQNKSGKLSLLPTKKIIVIYFRTGVVINNEKKIPNEKN